MECNTVEKHSPTFLIKVKQVTVKKMYQTVISTQHLEQQQVYCVASQEQFQVHSSNYSC